jgi:hypothetical protein
MAAAACGHEQPSVMPTPPATTAPHSAATTGAPPVANGAVTPDQVCALVDPAQMSQITGFTISSTRPAISGNVAVCHYESSNISKVILEYQPDGKGAVEFTKTKGQAVAGIGTFAVYFKTSAQLSVELGGDAVFHVFIEDVRANQNNPKEAAVRIAQIAVPKLQS